MKNVISAFVLGLLLVSTANAQGLPEQSLWKNTKGSLLLVTKVDTEKNSFSGTFVNYAAGYACRGVPVGITGTVSGDTVSMVANFEPCAATITIFKGTLSGSSLSITFDLRYVDKNHTFQQAQGSDVFTKQ
jgi:hypothetical protein